MSLIKDLQNQLMNFALQWGYPATEIQVGPDFWNEFFSEILHGTTFEYSMEMLEGGEFDLKVLGLPVKKGRWGIYVCDPSKTLMEVQDFSHTWPGAKHVMKIAAGGVSKKQVSFPTYHEYISQGLIKNV